MISFRFVPTNYTSAWPDITTMELSEQEIAALIKVVIVAHMEVYSILQLFFVNVEKENIKRILHRTNPIFGISIILVFLGGVYFGSGLNNEMSRLDLLICSSALAYFSLFYIEYYVIHGNYVTAKLTGELPGHLSLVFKIWSTTIICLTIFVLILVMLLDSNMVFGFVWLISSLAIPSAGIMLYYLSRLRSKLLDLLDGKSQHLSQMTNLEKAHAASHERTLKKLGCLLIELWILLPLLEFLSLAFTVRFLTSNEASFSESGSAGSRGNYDPLGEIFFVGLMLQLLLFQYYAHVPFPPHVAEWFIFLDYLSCYNKNDKPTKSTREIGDTTAPFSAALNSGQLDASPTNNNKSKAIEFSMPVLSIEVPNRSKVDMKTNRSSIQTPVNPVLTQNNQAA